MLSWQKARIMKLITYAEEPICNNFSVKKKEAAQSYRQGFLPLPPPLYFLLPLICLNVEANGS